MAVLTPPDGSALDTVAAGRWAVQVDITPDAAPTWTWVNGLTSFEPTYKSKLEDDSDITYDGWESQANVGNALSVAFEGLVKGTTTGNVFSPDPGMNYLLQSSKKTGADAHVHMRHWHLDGLADAIEYYAAVDASPKGGKANELQKFSGSLIGRGKPKDITAPTGTYLLSAGGGTGSIVLKFGANTAAGFAHNASASAVKAPLVALDDGYGAADWTVVAQGADWLITPPSNAPFIIDPSTALTGGTATLVQQ